MEVSRRNKAVLEAFNRGYRIVDGQLYNPDGVPLNGSSSDDYKYFSINKKIAKVRFHRLVAYQKYGDKLFEDGIEVRHKDGNSLNNFEYNIKIGTHKDNIMDIPKEIRMKKAIKASKKIRKFTDEEIEEIRKDYSRLKSYKKVMEKWGITSKGTMNYILNNNYVTKKGAVA